MVLGVVVAYCSGDHFGEMRSWHMSDVIHTLLECDSVSFGPEDIAKLVAGFESALTNLGLKERNDPATTQIAKLIIQLAKDGQRDPKHLAERATRIVRGSS